MTAGARHLNTVHTRCSWHCLLLAGIWGLGAWLAPAQGFADKPASIWYRSSEGCPDGSNFVARVEARGKTARIAVVGDRVDFVVTLGAKASTAHGRLERQTSEGIVAIREVDGTSCEEVADALAFSLALSDGPPGAEPSQSREANAAALPSPALPVEAAPEAQSAARSSVPAASVPPLSVHPSFIAPSARAGPVGVRTPSKIDPLWLGLLGTGRTAMAPRGAWGAAFGLEQDTTRGLGWQLYLGTDVGKRTTTRRHMRVQLYSARMALCPLRLNSGALGLTWCGAAETGLLSADGSGVGGTRDRGVWFSLGVLERLKWTLSPSWALGLDLAALTPLTRYKISAVQPPQDLHTVSPVDWSLRLGAFAQIN